MSDDLFAQSVTYALAPLLARTTHGPSISSPLILHNLWSCDVLAQVVPDLLQVLLHFLGVVARIALGDRMGNLLKVHS